MQTQRPVPARGQPTMAVPRVAGLTLCRPVGRGAVERWRARDTSTGHEVLLRPLPPGGSAGRIGSLPSHPHLLVPWVLPDEHGRELLVLRWAAQGGLDRLMAGRDGLLPGEASALGVGLARALATLHADGQVHGAVAPRSVVLDEALRPMLDSVPMLVSSAPGAAPADDVAALGSMLLEASARPVPAELTAILGAAAHPDPALRPSAAQLVRQLATRIPPEAVRPVLGSAASLRADPAADPGAWVRGVVDRLRAGVRSVLSRVRARRGRHVRGIRAQRLGRAPGWARTALRGLAAAAAVTLAVVGGVVWAGLSSAGGGPEPTPGSASATVVARASPQPADASPRAASGPLPSAGAWATVVFDLDRLRAEAFATGDSGELEAVDAAGSPALASDRAAMERLVQAGATAYGYRSVLRSVRLLAATSSTARLEVVDERPSYELVGRGGQVLAQPAARGPRAWLVDLVRVDERWLVREVRASG